MGVQIHKLKKYANRNNKNTPIASKIKPNLLTYMHAYTYIHIYIYTCEISLRIKQYSIERNVTKLHWFHFSIFYILEYRFCTVSHEFHMFPLLGPIFFWSCPFLPSLGEVVEQALNRLPTLKVTSDYFPTARVASDYKGPTRLVGFYRISNLGEK